MESVSTPTMRVTFRGRQSEKGDDHRDDGRQDGDQHRDGVRRVGFQHVGGRQDGGRLQFAPFWHEWRTHAPLELTVRGRN